MPVTENLTQEEQIQKVLQDMCCKYSIEIILGTNRKYMQQQDYLQGYYVTPSTSAMSELLPVTIYDRVGGGDGFAAGAIYAYMHKYKPEKMLSFATMAGVLAHTTYGDSPILSKKEIEDILENDNHDIQR
jgi:2-dehydro-3-deoxygluconokinase